MSRSTGQGETECAGTTDGRERGLSEASNQYIPSAKEKLRLRSAVVPVRCAILPPAPAPYRDPLYARLARRGRIDPTVVYQSSGQPGWDQPDEWFSAGEGYRSLALRSRQRSRPGRTPVVLPRGLSAALAEVDPGCVVAWEFGPATLRALAWCRRRGRALVVFSELPPAADSALTPVQRRLHRLLAPRVDGFVAAGSAARERLLALGARSVEVSLQSADVEAFRAVAGACHEEGPVRVLSVGRLVPDKAPAVLVEAFAAAGLGPEEARLELCGTGPLEDELRREAGRLGVPLELTGYVSPAELPRLYAAAGVAALVSAYEPFGVTMREAAAAGLPLVCSRAAGAAGDVAVDGRNAILVDPGDVAGTAEALRRLVRDPELRARMAAESRAVDAENDPEADAEAFERAVLRAAQASRAGRSSRSTVS